MSYRTKQLIPLIGMLLISSYAVFSLTNNTNSRVTAFTGGTFEASGVAHVAKTQEVLFVDDGRPGEVFWLELDENGKQASAIKPLSLGVSVIDPEGMTTDGTHFYVVGSQSKPKGSEQAGLVRFKFNRQLHQVEDVQTVNGLKRWLIEHVTELRGIGERSYKDGGLNIEGLAWDPTRNQLLLGLRSPVINGQTLVIPLKLRAPGSAFTNSNLEVAAPQVMRLALGGAGVRSLEYDEQSQAFWLLTGAAQNTEKTEFKLWKWNGQPAQPALQSVSTFEPKLKPEGVTPVTTGQRKFTFLVFDTSGYAALE